jgi:hypothetical protein
MGEAHSPKAFAEGKAPSHIEGLHSQSECSEWGRMLQLQPIRAANANLAGGGGALASL